MKKIWISASLLVLCLALFLVFWIIPHSIDQKRNGLGAGISEMAPAKIPAIHSQLRIVDLHADTLLWDRDLLSKASRGHVDLPRLQEGGMALQVFSVVTKSPRGMNFDSNKGDSDNITSLAIVQRWPLRTWGSLSERALYQASRLRQAAQDSKGQLRIVESREDLRRFLVDREKDHSLVAGILAIEGSHALEGDLSKLGTLAQAGFRILSPAHFFDSEISGSQHGEKKAGLTELGRAWLKEMENRGLIVDLAHASSATIDEVLKISSRPPMVSHTGLRSVCETVRNLSDEQVKAIAAKGGLIAIGFWDDVNCGKDLLSVVKTIRRAVDVAGVESVALGSDWDGYVTTPIDAARMGWLTAKLVETGFTGPEIRAVMGENALRFLAENLP